MLERRFLDWSEPALPAVVRDLVRRAGDSQGICDLSRFVIVFPGAQASRRFLEILADETGGRNVPPRLLTVGSLPERLYKPKLPFASDIVQRLAWAAALQALPEDQLRIVVRNPPAVEDTRSWLGLGHLVSRQHRELAADLLDFNAVLAHGEEVEGFDEFDRWQALADAQRLYLRFLDDLELWDKQTARLFAVRERECQTDAEIVLVGAVDLNRTTRAMLEQVKEHVTSYVHADSTREDDFDEFGCLRPELWETATIPLERAEVDVAEGPSEQARVVWQVLDRLDERATPDDVTIGVPDEQLVPFIQRTLSNAGWPTRWVIEREVTQTGPYRLLEVIAEYLADDRSDVFAELVRHPDVSRWLDRKGLPADWLDALDDYRASHLQQRLDRLLGHGATTEVVRQIVRSVEGLLHRLGDESRPCSEWSQPIQKVLLDVYGDLMLDPNELEDRVILQSCRTIHDAAESLAAIPASLVPAVSADDAVRMVLDEVAGEIIPPEEEETATALYGWLELALDDAPVVVVTSMNEGHVPTSANHDLFLPNRLRTKLGLEDNARRYARDAYALSVLLHSRESVHLVVGKRDARGEPLVPSRLLFATNDATEAARRVQRFFAAAPEVPEAKVVEKETSPSPLPDFVVPPPDDQWQHDERFRVTEFRDYLASPYRYYLKHVLGLGAVDDSAGELDGASFGSVIHDVLAEFGASDFKGSTDERAIAAFLREQLDEMQAREFGKGAMFPVALQFVHARSRLDAFAKWQAGRVREGWRIEYVELDCDDVEFEIEPGRSIRLRGRIDRIDVHSQSGAWQILDYKTGDGGKPPDKVHRKKEEWLDLQLPLYRHLAKEHGVTGDVALGYMVLPADHAKVGLALAEWSTDELETADAVAREVAVNVLAGQFWKPLEDVPLYGDYGRICQDGVFGREVIL